MKKEKDWSKIKEKHELEDEELSLDEDEELISGTNTTLLEHPAYAELEEKLTQAEQAVYKAEQKANENNEKLMNSLAELANVRRRAENDVAKAHRYGTEKLLASLLPVLDSLEQALQLAEKEQLTSMSEGLQLTIKLFLDVLQKHDVHQLDPQGEAFNPQEHEAMAMQESPDVAPNSVMAVFQKGYKLNDRVIRPARVIVAKAKQ